MVGRTLGRYEVLRLLGEGGMGAVYEARDTHLERIVALKVMSPTLATNPEALRRLKWEAQALARLNHPNIVAIHDYLEADGELGLVMEMVTGEGLDKTIASRRPIAVERKVRTMVEVCNALQEAHGKGVIHRDLKPSNILMLANGRPKIVDFGIAKLKGADRRDATSHTRGGMGTIGYMSPEQFKGLAIDERTDVFSAGAVLYEFLSGVQPFEGETTAVTMHKLVYEPTPSLPREIEGVPPGLHAVIERALAKDAGERYQTAGEMSLALQAVVALAAIPRPPVSFPSHAIVPETKTIPEPSKLAERAPMLRQSTEAKPDATPAAATPSVRSERPEDDEGKRKNAGALVGVLLIAATLLAGLIVYALREQPTPSAAGQARSAGAAPVGATPPKASYLQLGMDAYTRGDYAHAAEYYRDGCQSGNGDLKACYGLGGLFYSGQGVEKDMAQAYGHFKAACDGNASGRVYEACLSLGSMYMIRGEKEEAAQYWGLACRDGDTPTSEQACHQLVTHKMPWPSSPAAHKPSH